MSDVDLMEVEERLEVAGYYSLLLKQPLFSVTDSTARAVQDEVRGFVKARLEALVGITTPESARGFTAHEVAVLKALAAKVLESDKDLTLPEKVGSVNTEKRNPAHSPRRRPKRRRRQAKREEAKMDKPKERRAAQVNPVLIADSKDATTGNRAISKTVEPEEVKAQSSPEEDQTPAIGSVVREEGRTYKIVDVDGKAFPMDITGQARTGQRGVPMPTGESLAQALELQARQDLQFVENNIALSLTKGAKGE